MVAEPLSFIKDMYFSILKKIKFLLSRGGPLYAKATSMTEDPIQHNIRMHDRVALNYEKIHTEIFNSIEQERIKLMLQRVLTYLPCQGKENNLLALDFGAGSGNLTKHMLDCGMHVVAADISEKFLLLIENNLGDSGRVSTFKLNGQDLSGLDDDSFDLVAAYSVLHHIPDYLASIREMTRVLKPGGLILLDHEAAEDYWLNATKIQAFRKLAINTKLNEELNTFSAIIKRLKKISVRVFVGIKRHILRLELGEGDIHVYMDDHIEWAKIAQTLGQEGLVVVHQEDYLLYNGIYSEAVWNAYKDSLTDARLLMARKR